MFKNFGYERTRFMTIMAGFMSVFALIVINSVIKTEVELIKLGISSITQMTTAYVVVRSASDMAVSYKESKQIIKDTCKEKELENV